MKKTAVIMFIMAFLLFAPLIHASEITLATTDLPPTRPAAPRSTTASRSTATQPRTTADSLSRAKLDKAVAEFRSLSRKEKRNRFKEVKKLIRQYKHDMKVGLEQDSNTNLVLMAILAILLPPLAIYLKEKNLSWKFWVSLGLVLTAILFFSSLAFLWLIASALALLIIFDIL